MAQRRPLAGAEEGAVGALVDRLQHRPAGYGVAGPLAAIIATVRPKNLSATIQSTTGQEVWLPLVGCTPRTCGGYSQNLATLTFRRGDTAVLPNGRLRIRIMSLADLTTGNIVGGKTLEVFVGFFDAPPSEQWWFSIGHVTVDERGNVNEFVGGPDGVPYILGLDVIRPLQIILNDPGERSETRRRAVRSPFVRHTD